MIYGTKHTRIRKLKETDLNDLVEFYSDDQVFIHDLDYPRDRAEVMLIVKRILDSYTLTEKNVHRYVIEYKSSNKVIGTISWKFKDSKGLICEIGGCLRTDYSNKGLGTEIFANLIQILFDRDVQQVFCSCSSENVRAIRVIEKLGFQKVGCNKMAIFKHGRYVDELTFGLMKTDA